MGLLSPFTMFLGERETDITWNSGGQFSYELSGLEMREKKKTVKTHVLCQTM